MSRGWIEDRPNRGLRWKARHRGADGKLRSKSFRRKTDAQMWLDEQRASLRTGTWLDPDAGKRRYSDWFEVWLASKHQITERTRFDYNGIYRSRLAAAFGEIPVRLIDRRSISNWRDDLLRDDLSPARIRKLHSVLSASLNAAVDEGLIARNPALRIELPRIELKRKRFLSADDIANLADAMPDRGSRVLTLVAAYGGLRWGELAALRRSRCVLLRRRLIVDSALSDIGGRLEWKAPKSHQAREVSLPAFVVEALARHLEHVPANPNSLIFTAPRGGPLRYGSFRRRIWDDAVLRAGLSPDVTLHTLRHSCASLMHDAGADLVLVSHQLGHESPAVTGKVYVGLFDDAADDVMERLDASRGVATAPPARPQRIAN
jgi:integrase